LFQPDLYPDCRGDEPNLELSAWVGGANATPKLVNLENGFAPTEKKQKTITKVEADKELSPTENKQKVEELTRRVAFLEAELAKRDARIKELGGQ